MLHLFIIFMIRVLQGKGWTSDGLLLGTDSNFSFLMKVRFLPKKGLLQKDLVLNLYFVILSFDTCARGVNDPLVLVIPYFFPLNESEHFLVEIFVICSIHIYMIAHNVNKMTL